MTSRMPVLVLVAAAALAVAGCAISRSSEHETAIDALPPQDSGSVDEIAVPIPGQTAPPTDLDVREFDGAADLRGPHYSLVIPWIATGRAIEEYDIPQVYDLEPRRAEDGDELMLIAVDGEYTNGQWKLGDQLPPAAELVIDGEATELTSVPLPNQDGPVATPSEGALLVASVPKGAPVLLRVTDEGRTQTVDLRSGKRAADEIPGYYQPYAQELSFDVDLPVGFTAGQPYATTLTVADLPISEYQAPQALLAPWTPANGWAPDGRAWLVLPHPVLSTPFDVFAPELVLAIDEAAVYAVRLPDGTEVPELGGTRQVTTFNGQFAPAGDELVFDVPADFGTGTYVMRLGKAGVLADDVPATWQSEPQPVEVAIDLAR